MISALKACVRLARIGWLPTIWSNVFAGWYLAGGRSLLPLGIVLIGGTLMFLGAALLDDAFDAEQDRRERPDRPIPAGHVKAPVVWQCGLGLMVAAILLFAWLGFDVALVGLLLAGVVIVHNGFHWAHGVAPLLLGGCRLLLYFIAALGARGALVGAVIWCAIAVALYAAGSCWLLRCAGRQGVERYWPLLLLLSPVILGVVMNAGPYREGAALLSTVLCLWILRQLRLAWWTTPPDISRAGGGLVAGIVLADWIAVCYAPKELGYYFIGFLLAAVVFQKLETLAALPGKQTAPGPA